MNNPDFFEEIILKAKETGREELAEAILKLNEIKNKSTEEAQKKGRKETFINDMKFDFDELTYYLCELIYNDKKHPTKQQMKKIKGSSA